MQPKAPRKPPWPPSGSTVQFLNVDLDLVGAFDAQPLLEALGDDVVVLHGPDAEIGISGDRVMVLEVNDSSGNLGLSGTLARFVELLNNLPAPARQAWHSAKARRFDIGIESGKEPHETLWTLSPPLLRAVADLDAELVITVYGVLN